MTQPLPFCNGWKLQSIQGGPWWVSGLIYFLYSHYSSIMYYYVLLYIPNDYISSCLPLMSYIKLYQVTSHDSHYSYIPHRHPEGQQLSKSPPKKRGNGSGRLAEFLRGWSAGFFRANEVWIIHDLPETICTMKQLSMTTNPMV